MVLGTEGDSVVHVQIAGSNGRYYDHELAQSIRLPPSLLPEVILVLLIVGAFTRCFSRRTSYFWRVCAVSVAAWTAARLYSSYLLDAQPGFGWLGNLVLFLMRFGKSASGMPPLQYLLNHSDSRMLTHIAEVRDASARLQASLQEVSVARVEHHHFKARDGYQLHILLTFPSSPGGLADDTRLLPLVVYFHGGAFVTQSSESMQFLARTAANAIGAVVASVDYRLAPEARFPTAVEDCIDSVGFLAKHARRLGADPGRLILMGDSAGGNLAAVTALATARPPRWQWRMFGSTRAIERVRLPRGARVAAQILLQPVIAPYCPFGSAVRLFQNLIVGEGLCTWMWNAYLSDPLHDAADPRASPLLDRHVLWSRVPPAIVVTGHFDPLADEGDAYANHLAKRGVQVHATRRLEVHSMHGPDTLSWAFGAAKAVAHGEQVEVPPLV